MIASVNAFIVSLDCRSIETQKRIKVASVQSQFLLKCCFEWSEVAFLQWIGHQYFCRVMLFSHWSLVVPVVSHCIQYSGYLKRLICNMKYLEIFSTVFQHFFNCRNSWHSPQLVRLFVKTSWNWGISAIKRIWALKFPPESVDKGTSGKTFIVNFHIF